MVAEKRTAARETGLFERLVAASPRLGTIARRRQARLVAISALILFVVFASVDVVLAVVRPDYATPRYGYVLLAAAYALSRTRHLLAGAALVVAMFPVVVFLQVTTGEGVDPMFTFGFLVLAVLMSTIVLGKRGVAAITLVNVAAIVGARLVAPEVIPSLTTVMGPLAVNVLAGLLAIAYMRHRDQVEAERQAELLRAQGELRQAQKMEAIGRFAGGIAHDFNNMLAVIKGNLALMEGDAGREERVDIEAAVASAAALTRQLLTVARSGKHRAEPHPANEVVESAVRLIRRIIGEDVEIQTSFAEPVWWLHGDRHQLEQALLNLASNARDAMPDGGRLGISTHNVTLSPEDVVGHDAKPGEFVLIRMSDTGAGMDEDTRRRVFEPFFTTKEADKGTGLGLAMVFGTVAQGGGLIRVDSEPGVGTTFELFLPRRAPSEFQAVVEDLGEQKAGAGRILVVEDDEAVRRTCERVLVAAGYEVIGVAGTHQALERIDAEPGLDLVLSDVVMPGMSGPDLARRVREEHPGLRFVFMTGHAASEVTDDIGPVIDKPFDSDELLALVGSVLASTSAD